jgi:hypothetical protein
VEASMEASASSITGQCRRQQHRWACMVDGRALYSLHFSSCRESLSCSALVAPAGVKFSPPAPVRTDVQLQTAAASRLYLSSRPLRRQSCQERSAICCGDSAAIVVLRQDSLQLGDMYVPHQSEPENLRAHSNATTKQEY